MGGLGIDMTPSFRTTQYRNMEKILGTEVTKIYSYNNLYLPLIFSLKPGFMPLVIPYLGLGGAGNFQLDGKIRVESGGTGYDTTIKDLANDLMIVAAIGVQINLIKFKLLPEFSFNYNLTSDDPETTNYTESNYDINLSLGLYYSP